MRFVLRPVYFLLIISILFLSLRLFNLPQNVNFGSDAARDFLVIWNMYQTKHPILIGPPSEYAFNGRQFFFGPAPYYLILPALLIGQWNPLAVSYFLIFLNLVTLLIALGILNACLKNKSIVFYFAFFCTFTPIFVTYAQSYWNPYLMLPVSTFLVALIIKSRNLKQPFSMLLLIGFLFGLGLQFHYSFIIAIIISCFWLFFNRKVTLQSMSFLLVGFIFSFFPLILFELRNHFYNLNTMLLILSHPSNAGRSIIFNSFYLISLLPFLFYWLSLLLVRINNISRSFIVIFLVGYCLWSLFVIFSPHPSVFSYHDSEKLAKRIAQDSPKNFNIVDQLTRDNRATGVRYLLTIQGFAPRGITEYANVQTLYIYSKLPLEELVKHPVYEIQSFLPYKSVATTEISDHIFLYKLQK